MRIFVAAALAVVAAPALSAEPPVVQWTGAYARFSNAGGNCVAQTSDGGYIVCGGTDSVLGYPHFYLVRVSTNGSVLWDTVYTGTVGDAQFVTETNDGGFVLAGESDGLAYVMRTTATGSVVWSGDVGANATGRSYSIAQTQDSGYVVGGVLAGNLPVLGWVRGMAVVKLTAQGTVSWRAVLSEDYGDEDAYVRVVQASDGGFVVAGRSGTQGLRLAKLSTTGGVVWERTYPVEDVGDGRSLQQTSDGGFIVTGGAAADAPDPGYTGDLYLLKADSLGYLKWVKKFGGCDVDEGRFVSQTSDGGFVVAGLTRSDANADFDGYIVRTNASGVELWSKTIGVEGRFDEANCVRQTTDGGFAIAGMGFFNPATDTVFMFLQKLAPESQ